MSSPELIATLDRARRAKWDNYEKNFPKTFWESVDQSGGPDACWPWKRKRTAGYGRIIRRGITVSAHRVAYELVNGRISPDLFVCHRCDNPPCCNPAHLFAGSHDANMADRHQKGRYLSAVSRVILGHTWKDDASLRAIESMKSR